MSTEPRTSGSPVDGRTVAELSLAEQAALGSGADFWTTKAVGFVPSILMTDGPHGVRRQEGTGDHLGIAASEPATCFPPAVSLAQTWDLELVSRVGAALGREAQAQGVHVLLGPGINIRRDPRCGRNFEYFSEDPFVAGALGAAYVQGLQSQGVGASVKHFAANNQEYDRMLVSADVDPRTLREIYLRAFQRVVSEADPWTVMAAYNRINGVPAAQNHWLLSEVLRGEWGYEGVVVSDWGAVGDRPAAVAAGLDLQMPGTGGASDEEVIAAVEEGRLDPAAVERAAERVAGLAHMATAAHREDATFDADEHHALARQAAGRGIVLLRNEGDLLPLDRSEPLAVIGAFAESLRYQGGGSSHVNPTRVDVPLEEIRARSDDVVHAPGFTLDGSGDATALRDEAVTAARSASVAVVFLGLSETRDSEGADRPDIELPSEQLEVLRAVVAAQPRTVVVLFHGGVVCLAPVVASAPAILDAALPGQAGGAAVADVLFGAVNPSGKLTETVPVRVEDAPAYLNFPGERSHVLYGEGLHVGYRWYDARNLDVTFPFGHGLSYTTFEYSQFTVRGDEAGIVASVTVTNTGPRAGREVVQLYVGLPGSEVTRPARQLAGFGIVDVTAGASSTIEIAIRRDELAYWDQRVERWVVESGDYVVAAGASSRDLRLSATARVDGDAVAPPVTLESALEDVMRHPVAGELLRDAIAPVVAGSSNDESRAELNMDVSEMVARMPLSRIASFSQGRITKPQLEALIAEVERRALDMDGGPGPAGI